MHKACLLVVLETIFIANIVAGSLSITVQSCEQENSLHIHFILCLWLAFSCFVLVYSFDN